MVIVVAGPVVAWATQQELDRRENEALEIKIRKNPDNLFSKLPVFKAAAMPVEIRCRAGTRVHSHQTLPACLQSGDDPYDNRQNEEDYDDQGVHVHGAVRYGVHVL